MGPLLDRVNSMIESTAESVQAQPADGRKYPANLTGRQVQVLRLIAQGKTNEEIAAALMLSKRTIDRHLADVYAKIGARNRVEAAAFTLNQLP